MKRKLFHHDHLLFRDAFRRFLETEVLPHHQQWEQAGIVPREIWQKAGEMGFLGMQVPEAFGGHGAPDFRYNVVVTEEVARAGATGIGFGLHSDIAIPYILVYGSEEQKHRWLPSMVRGEAIGALGLSEPDAGSDLAAIRTTAVRRDGGYILNGQKTFITNGINGDIVIVAARTRDTEEGQGMSLLVVERGMAGFTRGRNLEKIGLKAQDTAEMFFTDVVVPESNRLGREGRGFHMLMHQLPQERLAIALMAVAASEAVLEMTGRYVRERQVFGQSLGKFQHTRFLLAELQTEVQIGRVFVDRCVEELEAGTLSTEEASMAKWWTTELQQRVVDRCLQLYGGYGYMAEYPISRFFVDARVQTIYGGTTEIMKEIIARKIG
ncbi:MAG: acyl-CoA dehydrogenase family protein [Chloroflexota bacterium]|jgi:alkylation response protein AidB-like acyl-CoA dehydrogenase